ncbi:MAG: hypothetical protein COB76_00595 [Alphaproteobacteria bacterium]|nr:MAG: hypothetical protein COB76_00595 [Alphaproteobacteria bacterium]
MAYQKLKLKQKFAYSGLALFLIAAVADRFHSTVLKNSKEVLAVNVINDKAQVIFKGEPRTFVFNTSAVSDVKAGQKCTVSVYGYNISGAFRNPYKGHELTCS